MRFPDVTLATFAPLTLVDMPDEEILIRDRMVKVKERWSYYDPPLGAAYDTEMLEFDPIKITMEAGASFELNALTRINQMGRATTLAFSWGANLDAIASRYPGGVPRLPEETYLDTADPTEKTLKDNRYRRRIWLAPNALAASGTAESYTYWALTADGSLKDASAIVLRPSLREDPIVRVTLLDNGPDPRPSQARIAAVSAFLHREEIQPLTDVISTEPPKIKYLSYRVGLWLYPDADLSFCLETVQRNLADLVIDQYWLGMDHTRMMILAACAVPGVQNARVDTPVLDEPADPATAILVQAVDVFYLGRRE